MKSFLTGHDLANTVKMAHNQRHVTFLLVEGTTDVTLFQKFTDTDRCEILACHGRPNALSATVLLDEDREGGISDVRRRGIGTACQAKYQAPQTAYGVITMTWLLIYFARQH